MPGTRLNSVLLIYHLIEKLDNIDRQGCLTICLTSSTAQFPPWPRFLVLYAFGTATTFRAGIAIRGTQTD